MKRNRRLFSAYEMELLARNPYTYRVRARQLLFTAEFKRRFWEQYERGGDVQQIFENMGYDPLVVGYTRMHSVPQNLRKVVEAGRPFTDGYSGRGKKSSESGWHKSRSEQQAEEMQKAQQEEIKTRFNSRRSTGALLASIKVSAVKEIDGGKRVEIYPNGKDKHGVRNAEKGFVLNYGRSNMPARPWFTAANEKAADDVVSEMRRVWEEKQNEER